MIFLTAHYVLRRSYGRRPTELAPGAEVNTIADLQYALQDWQPTDKVLLGRLWLPKTPFSSFHEFKNCYIALKLATNINSPRTGKAKGAGTREVATHLGRKTKKGLSPKTEAF